MRPGRPNSLLLASMGGAEEGLSTLSLRPLSVVAALRAAGPSPGAALTVLGLLCRALLAPGRSVLGLVLGQALRPQRRTEVLLCIHPTLCLRTMTPKRKQALRQAGLPSGLSPEPQAGQPQAILGRPAPGAWLQRPGEKPQNRPSPARPPCAPSTRRVPAGRRPRPAIPEPLGLGHQSGFRGGGSGRAQTMLLGQSGGLGRDAQCPLCLLTQPGRPGPQGCSSSHTPVNGGGGHSSPDARPLGAPIDG